MQRAAKRRRGAERTARPMNASHHRKAAEFPTASLESELSAIGKAVPAREWIKVPVDYFANHDHYVSGAPKKK
jgi:hypothetical protein